MKVKYVRFQTNVFLGGLIGDLGSVLPSSSKTLEYDMKASTPGLELTVFTGASGAKLPRPQTFLIPWANVVLAEYTETPRE